MAESKTKVYATVITVRTRFSATHMWKEAPDECFILRHPHRHEFHVIVEIRVSHDNRDIEFIGVKNTIDGFVADRYGNTTDLTGTFVTTDSCEQMATQIGEMLLERYSKIDQVSVEVQEDGENGGRVMVCRIKDQVIGLSAAINRAQKELLEIVQKSLGKGLVKKKEEEAKKTPLDLPVPRLRPFFGVEAEGPLVGMPTLFVPCGAKPEDIRKAKTLFFGLLETVAKESWNEWNNSYQIYLGAGDSPFNGKIAEQLMHECLTAVRGLRATPVITIEVNGIRECEPLVRQLQQWRSDAYSHLYLPGYLNIATTSNQDMKINHEDPCCPDFFKVVSKNNIVWHRNPASSCVAKEEPKTWKTSKDEPLFQHDVDFEGILINAEQSAKLPNLIALWKNWLSTPENDRDPLKLITQSDSE